MSGKPLRDVLADDLDVLFCGINPSLLSAARGHHFARPGNRFWPALHRAGLTPRQLTPEEDALLPRARAALGDLEGAAFATRVAVGGADLHEALAVVYADKVDVASYQAMTGWSDDHVPFPGAAARQTVQMLVRENGMLNDRLTVGGDPVSLRDIRVPFLTVRAERDHIVPPEATAPLIDLVGSEDKHELSLAAGHMGLVVGRTAAKTTVPTILDFLRRRSDEVGSSTATEA